MKTDNTELKPNFTAFENVPQALPEAILNAYACASGDATRYHLMSPIVRKVDSTTVEVVANNGHCLSRRQVVVGALAEALQDGVCYQPVEGALDLLKLMLKKAPKSYSVFEACSGKDSFTLQNAQSKVEIRLTKQELYPDFEHIYPKLNAETTITLGLNPEYLVDLLKAMAQSKGDRSIYLSFDTSKVVNGQYLTPMMIQVGQEKQGLLMPCRLGEKQK